MEKAAAVVIVAVLILLAVWARVHNYNECRAHGLSVFYCSTAVR